MKLILILAVAIATILVPIFGATYTTAAARIDPALAAQLAAQPAAAQTSVIVTLAQQADVRAVGGRDRKERKRNTVQALHHHADSTQASLRALLRQRQREGHVTSFEPLWVLNAIALTADDSVLSELATMPEVASITPDVTLQAPPRTAAAAAGTASAVAPNLSAIGVQSLWSLGFFGQGVVVASLDTGVDMSHPDIASRWRGGTNSWYDPYGQHSAPVDLNGHGTWTMGVMVAGSDSTGTAIGAAPAASWIAARIYNDSGSATTSSIHKAFQWLLDPDGNPATADAPDVVNNSWALGLPGTCSLSFEPDLQSLVAAGIVPVFAAGNYGPGGSTSVSPANNPDAFAVGAVDTSGAISGVSSVGPSACGQSAIFPSVVAPGVSIETTDLYGGYYSPTGTSLSAPHVAGAAALLLSAFPAASVAQVEAALQRSAIDLGAPGPDTSFGAGEISLPAAYQILASAPPAPTATNTPAPTATNTPIPTATNTPIPTATNTPIPTATATVAAAPAGALFSDGFESGGMSAWSAAVTGGGRLSVTSAAALAGSYGLQAQISGGTPIYVADTSPAAESQYHARFAFAPNSAALKSGTTQDLLDALSATGGTVFSAQMRSVSGVYQLRAVAATGSLSRASSWYTLSNATHSIEIVWQAASTSGGSNGAISLWLDGTLKQTVAGVMNGALRVDEVRLGAPTISGTASGTERFDSFTSSTQ